MNKNDKLIMLNGFFLVSLVIANVVAGKVIDIYGLIVPAAIVAYPITFLCTDVISELYGKEEAKKAVSRGIILQIFSLVVISLAIKLPIAVFAKDMQTSFIMVLGQSARVIIASLSAYIVSQSIDVHIFHKLKKTSKHKWLRNNASTVMSQLIDTAIFITIAFYGVVPNIIVMIFSQYLVKCILALIDTPFFYLLTKESDNRWLRVNTKHM